MYNIGHFGSQRRPVSPRPASASASRRDAATLPAEIASAAAIGHAGEMKPTRTMDDPLRRPLEDLPGATPTRRDVLARLGIETVGDLLYHFPRAYEDLTDVRAIRDLAAGELQTVQGEVVEITSRDLPGGPFL